MLTKRMLTLQTMHVRSVRACVCEFRELNIPTSPHRRADDVPTYLVLLLGQLYGGTFRFADEPQSPSHPAYCIPSHRRQMAHTFHSHYYSAITPIQCPDTTNPLTNAYW
jgi:hypothetical protein